MAAPNVPIVLSNRERQLLALLAEGLPCKTIGQRMKIGTGSARVYLSNLYRKLGVSNRTAALSWYIRNYVMPHSTIQICYIEGETGGPELVLRQSLQFGSYALKSNLLIALGAANVYIGSTATGQPDNGVSALSMPADPIRFLWEWLLQGDFAAANHVQTIPHKTEGDQPCADALLAMLLLLGKQLKKAEPLALKALERHESAPLSCAVVRTLQALQKDEDGQALPDLHRYVAEMPPCHPAKHAAMIVLFYVYRNQGDLVHAAAIANSIYAEAQGVQYLIAAQNGFPGIPGTSVTAKQPRKKT